MAVFTVLPLIQGESTRAKVTPVAVLEDRGAPAEWLDDDDGDDMTPVGE